MSVFGIVGRRVRLYGRSVAYVTGTVCAALGLALRPSVWRRPLARVLTKQIYFTAIQAIPFVALVAALTGVTGVIQAQLLSDLAGQASLGGTMLVLVLVRELAPLLVNVIMIGRSGVAMAAELASMSVNGDVKTLDMQGMDPMVYLVMPRVVAAGIAVFCMTVVFVLIAFASGYWCGSLLGMMPAPDIFLNGVFNAVTRADGPSFLAKTLIPGMLTAGIACTEGLGIRGQLTEIPQAAARAVVRAMVAMALVSALISTVTYV